MSQTKQQKITETMPNVEMTNSLKEGIVKRGECNKLTPTKIVHRRINPIIGEKDLREN